MSVKMCSLKHCYSGLKERNLELLILLSSFIVGAFYVIIFYTEKVVGDGTYYYNVASLLKDDIESLFNSSNIGVQESLNAIIQGLAFKIPGNDYIAVYVVQLIVYCITALYIFKLSRLFIGNSGTLIVIVFYLLNHRQGQNILNFKPGVWVNLFIIFILYYVYLIIKNPANIKYYFLTALNSGLLLLTDMRYIPHLLFLYFILLFSRTSPIAKAKNISVSLIIIFLIITPWIIRQSIVFDKFVFISDLNTITIHRAFNTKYYQSLGKYKSTFVKISDEEYNKAFWEISDSLGLSPGEMIYISGDVRRDSVNDPHISVVDKYGCLIQKGIFTDAEIEDIINKKENKSEIIKKINRAGYLWAPFDFDYTYDPLSGNKTFRPPTSVYNNINRILTLGIWLPFLIIGLFFLIEEIRLYGIYLLGFFLIHTFVHAMTYVQWRYMLPVLPLINIIGIYGFNKTINWITRRKNLSTVSGHKINFTE